MAVGECGRREDDRRDGVRRALKEVVYGDDGATEYVFIKGDSVFVVETTDAALAAATIAAMPKQDGAGSPASPRASPVRVTDGIALRELTQARSPSTVDTGSRLPGVWRSCRLPPIVALTG